jgi:hypothetical protein
MKMMSTRRRIALLIGSIAMYAFVLVSPFGAKDVQALGCLQYCDADLQACNDNCDYLYENGSDDWNSCRSGCYSDWDYCYRYTGAVWCTWL